MKISKFKMKTEPEYHDEPRDRTTSILVILFILMMLMALINGN
jgi:hypothetical protein